jgi:hypothetical protein
MVQNYRVQWKSWFSLVRCSDLCGQFIIFLRFWLSNNPLWCRQPYISNSGIILFLFFQVLTVTKFSTDRLELQILLKLLVPLTFIPVSSSVVLYKFKVSEWNLLRHVWILALDILFQIAFILIVRGFWNSDSECLDCVKNASFFTLFSTKSEFAFFSKSLPKKTNSDFV